jgi:deoxyribonuclease-4
MNLGAHMSIAGGVSKALERGRSLGCDAVQLFVKNTNQWGARALPGDEIALFRRQRRSFPRRFVIAHASYLINLASPDRDLLERSIRGFVEEMERARSLDIPYIVIHPGSHRGSGLRRGLLRAARSLDRAVAETGTRGPAILLETTAGQGDTIGRTFEELAGILDAARSSRKLGVCFDTCHVFAAGYDLRTARAYEATLGAFDKTIGLGRIKAFHLNDSLRGLASAVDRHTHIGTGELGLEAFRLLVNDERFFDRPMILETPKGPDDRMDLRNLAVLRGLRGRRRPRRA